MANSTSSKLFPIEKLSVEGFKSINEEQSIEIRPLTILAGTNSSGKSSMIQPLLLLKQTLEAAYDPGPLLINGPNAKFTLVDQFLCKGRKDDFSFGLTVGSSPVKFFFSREQNVPVKLRKIALDFGLGYGEIREEKIELRGSQIQHWFKKDGLYQQLSRTDTVVELTRNRCFFDIAIHMKGMSETPFSQINQFNLGIFERFEQAITHTIHVPGSRGNPRRFYPLTSVGERFPGTFEEYVASVISAARQDKREDFLAQLGEDVGELGLTWKVEASLVDDTQVELRVGRLPKMIPGGHKDLVSIADVGFGVSQSLPVVVALLTARPGQLVYVEEPEIHLHPRAQFAMSCLLMRAANRGVRVVAETHSSLLLLGVQKLVAQERLDPTKVIMHWFQRDESSGITQITTADLDKAGAFGEWPADFDNVTLGAQQEYLDAAEKKLAYER